MTRTLQLNQALSDLNININCIKYEKHRHLELFDLVLGNGAKLSKLQNSLVEIGIKMKAKAIPIISVLSEKGIIRMKMASQDMATLYLNDLYCSPPKSLKFPILLGENDMGEPFWMDYADNPHMLVAGGTGSGKSSLLHTIVASALKIGVRVYVSDPKSGTEFGDYNSLFSGWATTYESTVAIAKLLHDDMEQRYELRAKFGPKFYLKKTLFVIDELADLMLSDSDPKNQNRKQLEMLILGLAQKSRAVGIHLLVATQRPSVNLISGSIKANLPARLACRVATKTDSKVVMGRDGAENLMGRGDAVFSNMRHDFERIHVAYIPTNEVKNFVRSS